MATAHVTFVLLYSSLAEICKVDVLLERLALISDSGLFKSGKVDPLTTQIIPPVLTLQLKVAVDPRVALTDVGMMVIAEI